MCDHDNTKDIDLHRFKCYDCGEICYYSGLARQAYEDNDLEAKNFLYIK